MGYLAQLRHKGGKLDLSSGRYSLEETFLPPVASEQVQISAGGSLGQNTGGELINVRGENYTLLVPLVVQVSSDGEGQEAISEINEFIRRGFSSSWPVYFDWRSDTGAGYQSFNSVWSSNRTCEVVWGQAERRSGWGVFDRTAVFEIDLIINLKPYIRTNRQRVGRAQGGVHEAFIGNALKKAYGTRVGPAITNLHTNPLFYGDPTVNNWNAGSGIVQEANFDQEFILYGDRSRKLTGTNATASNNTYTENITFVNLSVYTLTYYVKLRDGGAVSTTQCQVWYDGSAQTTTYHSVGAGWYRLEASITGDGTSNATGVVVNQGYSIYITGAQAELGGYPTGLAYGELPGCAWSGGSHSTSTTRTAGRLWTLKTAPIDEGTILIVWQAPRDDTDYTGTTNYLIFSNNSSFSLSYNGTSTDFDFTDGTNTASGGGSFSAGDLVVFHLTWSKANGLRLIINGASAGTNATYTPPTSEPSFYIGSDATPANHSDGVFLAPCTFYDAELSVTQALADYTNLSSHLTNLNRIDWLPYYWTKDGDMVTDVVTSATQDDWGFAAGIAGNTRARTIWSINNSVSSNPPMYIGVLPIPEFTNPDDLFQDLGGTVISGALGGECNQQSVNTTAVQASPAQAIDANTPAVQFFSGKQVYFRVRLSDAGSDLTLTPVMILGSTGDVITGDYVPVTTDTTLRHYILGPLIFPVDLGAEFDFVDPTVVYFSIRAKRSVAGAANVNFDFYRIIPGDLAYIDRNDTFSTAQDFLVDGDVAFDMIGDDYIATASVRGDLPNFYPGEYNVVTIITHESGAADAISATNTINRLEVYPTWLIG